MSPKIKLPLATAAGILLGCLLLSRSGPLGDAALPEPLAPRESEATVPSRSRGLSGARGPVESDTTRRTDGLPAKTIFPERPRDPELFEIDVLVRDELDLPLEGAEVYLAPLFHPLNFVGTTGPDGRILVRFRARRPAVDLALFVESPDLERDRAREETQGEDFTRRGGVLSGLRRFQARSDAVTRVALAPRSDDVLGLWIEQARRRSRQLGGRSSKGKELGRLAKAWRRSRSKHSFERSIPPATMGEIVPLTAPLAELDDEGELTFVAPAGIGGPELLARVMELERRGEFALAESLESRQRRVDAERAAVLAERRRARAEEAEPREERWWRQRYYDRDPSSTSLLVTVTRADGSPAAWAPLALDVGGGWDAPVFTDENGRHRFHTISAGVLRIRAGGGDHGISEEELRLRLGARNTWETTLDRGTELLGRLLDEKGSPRAHWQVELELTGQRTLHVDTTIADAEGRFAIPNLPCGAFRLLLRPPGPWGVSPTGVIDRVLPSAVEHEFLVAPDEQLRSTAFLEVGDPTGARRADAEVRLWSEELDRGVWIASAGPGESVESVALFPGPYEYVVGCSSRGWSSPRGFRAGTLGQIGLGVLILEEPGWLVPKGQVPEEGTPYRGLRLVEIGSGLDVLVIDEEQRIELPLRLPAGEYRIDYADGTSTELELLPGEAVEIELPVMEPAEDCNSKPPQSQGDSKG